MGWCINFFISILIIPIFIIITIIDFRYYIIPDELNYFGVFLGLSFGVFSDFSRYFELFNNSSWVYQLSSYSILNSILGVLLGAGLLYSISWITSLALNREAMGGGDIKLIAFIGACLGYKTALLSLGLSSIFGSIFGIFIIIKSKLIDKKQGFTMIAYGPYIILATLVVLYFGDNYLVTQYEDYSRKLMYYFINL